MKNTTIKNVLFILSGMMIAASASIFAAQNTTTIEANLVNLRQYLKELYITSTGTPAGDVVMHIDGSGRMIQYRQQDDVEYYLLNTDQLGNPHA